MRAKKKKESILTTENNRFKKILWQQIGDGNRKKYGKVTWERAWCKFNIIIHKSADQIKWS